MSQSKPRLVGGVLMLLIGIAAFLIRFQHTPYALPRGGNLAGGLLSLAIGAWLLWGPRGGGAARALGWVALAATPVALYLGLYATMAELEEVVVLRVGGAGARPAELRLWIVDRDDGTWVTMRRRKADAHGLEQTRVELLRGGEVHCVVATRHEDRPTVESIHALRQGKYAVQRFATRVGIFGPTASPDTVALRLDPCPPS